MKGEKGSAGPPVGVTLDPLSSGQWNQTGGKVEMSEIGIQGEEVERVIDVPLDKSILCGQ